MRDADSADLPRLLALYQELRDSAARPLLRRPTLRPDAAAQQRAVADRLTAAEQDPDARVLVVELPATGEVVGMTMLRLGSASTVVQASAVEMSLTLVTRRARGSGAGRALIAEATLWAERRGAESVVVHTLPGGRDVGRELNRFYARLGFAPVLVRRAAPVTLLRRTLGEDVLPARTVPALVMPESASALAGRRRRLVVGRRHSIEPFPPVSAPGGPAPGALEPSGSHPAAGVRPRT